MFRRSDILADTQPWPWCKKNKKPADPFKLSSVLLVCAVYSGRYRLSFTKRRRLKETSLSSIQFCTVLCSGSGSLNYKRRVNPMGIDVLQNCSSQRGSNKKTTV